MTAALVVGRGILLHPEKIGDLHHAVLLQHQILILRDLADSSLLAVDFDAGKVFGKPFFKPGIDSGGKNSVHELVGILVENHAPGILRRHVEHDEAAILASLKQSRKLHRLSVPQGRKLPKLLGIAKGYNLQGDGNVHVRLRHQGAEDGPHLFETHGGLSTTLFTRIGHHGEMRRLDFNPVSLVCEDIGNRAQREHKQEDQAEEPSKMRAHCKAPDG